MVYHLRSSQNFRVYVKPVDSVLGFWYMWKCAVVPLSWRNIWPPSSGSGYVWLISLVMYAGGSSDLREEKRTWGLSSV